MPGRQRKRTGVSICLYRRNWRGDQFRAKCLSCSHFIFFFFFCFFCFCLLLLLLLLLLPLLQKRKHPSSCSEGPPQSARCPGPLSDGHGLGVRPTFGLSRFPSLSLPLSLLLQGCEKGRKDLPGHTAHPLRALSCGSCPLRCCSAGGLQIKFLGSALGQYTPTRNTVQGDAGGGLLAGL